MPRERKTKMFLRLVCESVCVLSACVSESNLYTVAGFHGETELDHEFFKFGNAEQDCSLIGI